MAVVGIPDLHYHCNYFFCMLTDQHLGSKLR